MPGLMAVGIKVDRNGLNAAVVDQERRSDNKMTGQISDVLKEMQLKTLPGSVAEIIAPKKKASFKSNEIFITLVKPYIIPLKYTRSINFT